LQGTNKGEFYTDVCRDVSGLIISFLLFSSSAEKGGITKFRKELHFKLVLPDI
jgi:hypothetical protein